MKWPKERLRALKHSAALLIIKRAMNCADCSYAFSSRACNAFNIYIESLDYFRAPRESYGRYAQLLTSLEL